MSVQLYKCARTLSSDVEAVGIRICSSQVCEGVAVGEVHQVGGAGEGEGGVGVAEAFHLLAEAEGQVYALLHAGQELRHGHLHLAAGGRLVRVDRARRRVQWRRAEGG